MYKKSAILKSAMDKKGVILKRAKELAKKSKTWADFSNALFDPFDGELVRSLPTKEDREAFRKTKVYREIRLLLQQKMRENGIGEWSNSHEEWEVCCEVAAVASRCARKGSRSGRH